MSSKAKTRGGYSLIEMTLALLVATLGVMATFALFPQGLDASRKSIDATEVSAFADFVFASMETEILYSSWPQLVNGSVMLNDSHALADDIPIEASGMNTAQTNYWRAFYFGPAGTYAEASDTLFTYTLDIRQGDFETTKMVRLCVWPGYRTDIITDGDGPGKTVFYREFVRREYQP